MKPISRLHVVAAAFGDVDLGSTAELMDRVSDVTATAASPPVVYSWSGGKDSAFGLWAEKREAACIL